MSAPSVSVSVIIVNWNTRDMVLRLLKSLSEPDETGHQLELIVVDNNSSDDSVEAIRREFPEVTLVAQDDNRGFAGGVNPGVEVATQPLVLLLNSDAETTRASIRESAQYMAGHPEAGILGPRILNPNRTHQLSAWRDPSLVWMALSAVGLSKIRALNFERYGEKVFTKPTKVGAVCGCALMVWRDLLVELGGLDEDYFMYFEETDLCVRVRQHGKEVHHAPVGECLHEDGGTSKTVKLRTFLDFCRSEILFHQKHGGTAKVIAAPGLLALAAAVRVPPLAVLSLVGGLETRTNPARAQLERIALAAQPVRWCHS